MSHEASSPVATSTVSGSQAIAGQALEFLSTHQIPPLPPHYAVAFDYFSGGSPALRADLDRHLASGKPLDAVILHDLHERHVTGEHLQQLRSLGAKMEQLLGGFAQEVGSAESGASEFSQTLERNLTELSADADPAALRTVATNLLIAANTVRESNQRLQQRLEHTMAESERLRGELETQRRMAMVDPLTALLNRRALDTHLEALLAVEQAEPLSVLMADIDHFKVINDRYGHGIGDAVIRNVAEVIRKCIRGADVAVRYGGEEFVVLLPNTSLHGAASVAESIRNRIECLRLRRKTDNALLTPFTVSLGITERRSGDTQDALLARADQALYQSKQNGRNRVTLAAPA